MFTHLISATATVTAHALLASTLGVMPIERAAAPSILHAVPAGSYALAHCSDFAALRSRAQRHDWYRLLESESGAPLLLGLASGFHAETDTDLLELLEVGKHLQGDSVFFLTQEVAGFVTTAPRDRSELARAMHAWLPDAGPNTAARQIELAGASVEIVAWRETEGYGWKARTGHFAAFVETPTVMGLYSGDSAELLLATVEASLAGLTSEASSPLVLGLEAARKDKPACHGIETFIDLTPFVAEAERELASALSGFVPDPTGLLGIDRDLWLLTVADVQPGTRIDCSAWMNIPGETLAARLADTFEPLPADLPTRLPRNLTSLYAWRWDLKVFYQRIRSAMLEKHGEDSLEELDQMLGMARAMGGVDPIRGVIDQLDGTFAVFNMRTERRSSLSGARSAAALDDAFDINGFGLLATLEDGGAFLAAFERLVSDGGLLESVLDLAVIEETNVYVMGEDDDDLGIAFLPRTVLFGFRETLPRSLRAATGVSDANLLDGSNFHAAFDQNLGCCFLACQDLSALEAKALETLNEPYRLPPAAGEAVGRNPFDALLTYTLRRTPSGFRFELHTQ